MSAPAQLVSASAALKVSPPRFGLELPTLPNPTFLPTIARELFLTRHFPREPEPDLVMEGVEQVEAYREGGAEHSLAMTYLFNAVHCTKTIEGARTVLDLGCGTGLQLCQIAQLNPSTQFVGLDLSAEMLTQARQHASVLGLTNVRFERGDITQLNSMATGSFEAVISTLALHHLPKRELLDQCFAEIARVLAPQGAVYLADFTRLKSRASVLFLSYRYEKREPALLLLDFERSLRAAFELDELRAAAAKHLPQTQTTSMALMPLLALITTAPRGVSSSLSQYAQSRRRQLPGHLRADLDQLRLLFKLSKLPQDPFSCVPTSP